MSNEAELQEPNPAPAPLELEGQNGMVLRQLMEKDAPEVVLFARGYIGKTEFVPQLKGLTTEEKAREWIDDPHFWAFGARQDGKGPIMALVTAAEDLYKDKQGIIRDDRASIGVVVSKKFKGKGVATNAVKTISQNLLKTRQFNTVRSYVNPANQAIRGLLEKCGFEHRGEWIHRGVIYDLDKPDEIQVSGQ